jgi:hypothetical protein
MLIEEEKARYLKLPFKEWDGKTPLCLFMSDQFFYTEDDINDFVDYNEGVIYQDIRLVICEPNYGEQVDLMSLWDDILPENFDGLPSKIEAALTALNNVIKEHGVISWSEGKYRTSISPEGGEKTI